MIGWFKWHRNILNWEWRSSPNHYTVFGYCLERANFTEQKFKGCVIPEGSFPTSHAEIAQNTGLTSRKIRKVLSDLKKSGELVTKSTRQGTVITVVNWEHYQNDVSQTDTQTGTKKSGKSQEKVTETSTIKKVRKKESKNNISGGDSEKKNSVPHKEILQLWNDVAQKLRLEKTHENENNLFLIAKAWQKNPDIIYFKKCFDALRIDSFYTGANKRDFKANFRYVMKQDCLDRLFDIYESRKDELPVFEEIKK